jgi:exopolyphosphatase/guanosine-5'-triphosphate,3'-diphosphate pyrophosphatase
LLGVIMQLSPSSLARIERVPKKRLDTLPLAAMVLDRLIDVMRPDRLVFSAQGLREGMLYSSLSPAQRVKDPLLEACVAIAGRSRRFDVFGQELFDWIDPLFPKQSAEAKRLRMAACLLGDIAWNEHPDYRAEQAVWRVLRMPVTGIDHPSRVFVATAIGSRYGANGSSEEAVERVHRLISEEDFANAQLLGKALRFAYTLSAGSRRILRATRLSLDKNHLTLKLPRNGDAFLGEMVVRRLENLAKQLARKPRLAGGIKKKLEDY